MANIVTTDKFVGTIFIDTSNTNVSTQVDAVITQLEPKYLSRIFGRENVSWIYANVETDGLEDFYDFVVTILSYFMYCEVEKNLYSTSTGVGQVILQGDTGVRIFDNEKYCENWNYAVDEMFYLGKWMDENSDLLPTTIEFNSLDYINQFGI